MPPNSPCHVGGEQIYERGHKPAVLALFFHHGSSHRGGSFLTSMVSLLERVVRCIVSYSFARIVRAQALNQPERAGDTMVNIWFICRGGHQARTSCLGIPRIPFRLILGR